MQGYLRMAKLSLGDETIAQNGLLFRFPIVSSKILCIKREMKITVNIESEYVFWRYAICECVFHLRVATMNASATKSILDLNGILSRKSSTLEYFITLGNTSWWILFHQQHLMLYQQYMFILLTFNVSITWYLAKMLGLSTNEAGRQGLSPRVPLVDVGGLNCWELGRVDATFDGIPRSGKL